jgi:hypothetical protein
MTHTKRIVQAAAVVLLAVTAPTVFSLIWHYGAHDNPYTLVFQQSAGETWKTQASNYQATVQAHGVSIPVGHKEFQLKIQNAKHSSGIGMHPDRQAVQFQQVLFPGVLPGIDVVYHSSPAHNNTGHAVEFDFRVAAGADPGNIRMDLGPAEAVTLKANGALSVYSAEAEVQMQPPVAWQENHGQRTYIDARYRLDDQVAGFELGSYDPALPILIDPTILVRVPLQPLQQTSSTDPAVTAGNATAGRSARALAFGSDGSIYLAGRNRAWLSKLNPAGNTELFHSYAGAATRDAINALAVDTAGNAYVAGSVSVDGAEAGFTATFDPNGNRSAYTALPAPATALVLGPAGQVYYAAGSNVTLQGGWQLTAPGPVRALAIDSNGILYAAGKQASTKDGGTPGYDAWVARVQVGESGAQWAWTMPLGGFGTLDEARALAIASDGSLYIAGVTNSFNFPVQNAAQDSFSGTQDAFIAKIRTDGSGSDWSTFYGGSGSTSAAALALDAAGNLMLAGSTDSPNLMLAQQPGNAGENGFFARLDTAGNILESAYSPAPGAAHLYSVASAPDGEAWVAGASSAGVEEVLAAKVSSNRAVAVPSRPGRSIKPLTAAGTAASLVFGSQPLNGTAGTTFSPFVVQVLDSTGKLVTNSNISITVTSSPAGITGSATAINGSATFNTLVPTTSGAFSLVATATGLGGATSATFNIAPGAPYHFWFSAPPPNGSWGIPLSPAVSVKIEDLYGNLCTSSTMPVTLASTPASVSLKVNAVNGVATFSNVVFNAVGQFSLEASSPLMVQIVAGVTIGPGRPAQMKFVAQPQDGTAGLFTPITVQVLDGGGNPVNDTKVAMVTMPSNLQIPGAITAGNGIASFNVQFTVAAQHTLTASFGKITATSNTFTISPAAPETYTFTPLPITVGAGVALAPFTVTPTDQYNNVCTNSTVPVSLQVVSVSSGLEHSFGGSTPVNGVVTFSNIAIALAGSYQLVAMAPLANLAILHPVGFSPTFQITAGPPAQATFSPQPVNGIVGISLPEIDVLVVDTYNNPISNLGVTLISHPAGFSASTTTSNGTARFSGIVFKAPGNYTLTASAGAGAGLKPTAMVTIQGIPTQVSFFTQPLNGMTGSPVAVVVQALDATGNVVAGSNVPITLTPVSDNITGTSLQPVNAVNGVATFNVVLTKPGSYSFTATSPALTSAMSNTFTIAVQPTKLVFSVQPPATAVVNQVLTQFQVEVQDDYGNRYHSTEGKFDVQFSAEWALPVGIGYPFPGLSGVIGGNGRAIEGVLVVVSAYLPGDPGPYTLVAASPGLTSAVSTQVVLQ